MKTKTLRPAFFWKLRHPLRLNVVLCVAWAASCAGTEADNPFAEPVEATPCKSKEEYAQYQLADAHSRVGFSNLEADAWFLSETGSVGAASAFANLGESLTPSDQFPSWLECLEWSYAEGELSLQIVNFRSGCAIDWTGHSYVTDAGAVTLRLDNAKCASANCFSCFYDARTQLTVRVAGPLPFSLILDNCGGDVAQTDWSLPVQERPRGMQCSGLEDFELHSTNGNASEYQRSLYAVCGSAAEAISEVLQTDYTQCNNGLSCINERCVPACSVKEDCPLPAFECRTGYCQLPL